MSDEEEESVSEGFSASEDEWKPTKNLKGGESSDDDDSDFENSPIAGGAGVGGAAASRKRESEVKPKSAAKVTAAAAKKRKSMGQSLRTKLYNKYRPPPKTYSSPTNSSATAAAGSNSPSASTSRTASKNATMPNESNETADGRDDSSSESSVGDYLVDPAELDLQSSFFNVNADGAKKSVSPAAPPPPVFDCNVGIANLSDSGSEDNNESSADECANTKAFDFRNLLEKANSLERVKETIAKRAAVEAKTKTGYGTSDAKKGATATDINSLLALGENPIVSKVDDDDDDDDEDAKAGAVLAPQKLSKTKSTRVKRHTKTRPTSAIVAAGDSDDSELEEVADELHDSSNANSAQLQSDSSSIMQLNGSLEIHVALPTRQGAVRKTQQDAEMAIRRKINRDIKERQLLLHKASLLCRFGRCYAYNRMLNDTTFWQAALKLLPSKNAYPTERGTEAKYFESLVTWYKGTVKLMRCELYPEKRGVTRRHVKADLLKQLERKEAHSKQDLVLMFIALLRGMGLQCRLVANLQPLPLRPAQSDLLTIKLKPPDPQAAPAVVPAKEEVKVESKPQAASAVKTSTENEKKVAATKNKKTTVEQPVVLPRESRKPKKAATAAKPTGEQLKEAPPQHKRPAAVAEKSVAKDVPQKSTTSKPADKGQVKPPGDNTKPTLSRLKREVAEKTVAKDLPQKVTATGSKSAAKGPEKPSRDTSQLALSKLKREAPATVSHAAIKKPKEQETVVCTPVARRTRKSSSDKPVIDVGSPKLPQIIVNSSSQSSNQKKNQEHSKATKAVKAAPRAPRITRSRSRSISPMVQVSAAFLQSSAYKKKFGVDDEAPSTKKVLRAASKSPNDKVKISAEFLKIAPHKRILRTRQKTNEATAATLSVPQLDGADDGAAEKRHQRPRLQKLQRSQSSREADSDEDFEPSPSKKPKQATVLPKSIPKMGRDMRVYSTDDEAPKKRVDVTAGDIWVEVWSDVEDRWLSVDLVKGKVDCIEAIRKSASSTLAYVFAYQNDLSLKDVTARYCPHWTTTVRKARVEKAWLDIAIAPYLGIRTARDRRENHELRRIHEEKPLPTAIGDFKDHPLYALERHLLKFQGIYPPDAPTVGFIRGEPIYSRNCVHLLHSREIWLKQARTVKLGEQPYKVVKARPKWDRVNQTVIKDQPLDIFGFWQTEDYDPPTAENGIVPRNAYGNVELFKACMLPKKTVHLKLPGLNRICRKLNIDCANAVVGFDFHQGACHPLLDGFVVCEEFEEMVKDAWEEDQQEQTRKAQEKYETRVFGNWKKLIRGLLIRERLKKKYNF